MCGVTESMSGRAGILRLLPFGVEEHPGVTPLRGGFPEVVRNPPDQAAPWFDSSVHRWLQRDLRALVNVSSLSLLRRFLAVLASRTGQLLDKTDIAAPLGVSVPTITSWLDALETSGVLIAAPPGSPTSANGC